MQEYVGILRGKPVVSGREARPQKITDMHCGH